MERVCDQITSVVSPVFTEKRLTEGSLKNQLKEFSKSGDRMHQTFSSGGFFSNRGRSPQAVGLNSVNSSYKSVRDSRLGNNVCVVKPQSVMNELHKKSHFKGATGFLLGQEASLGFKQTERLAEVFTQVAKSLKERRESME